MFEGGPAAAAAEVDAAAQSGARAGRRRRQPLIALTPEVPEASQIEPSGCFTA
jgi:hypothetical protein